MEGQGDKANAPGSTPDRSWHPATRSQAGSACAPRVSFERRGNTACFQPCRNRSCYFGVLTGHFASAVTGFLEVTCEEERTLAQAHRPSEKTAGQGGRGLQSLVCPSTEVNGPRATPTPVADDRAVRHPEPRLPVCKAGALVTPHSNPEGTAFWSGVSLTIRSTIFQAIAHHSARAKLSQAHKHRNKKKSRHTHGISICQSVLKCQKIPKHSAIRVSNQLSPDHPATKEPRVQGQKTTEA